MEEFTRDTVYKDLQKNIKKFEFDQKVANAFPDMIYRSVPGYRTIINYCGSISSKYIKEDSNCYDLGCSLGASTLSIIECNRDTPFCLHAVDNSVEMIKRLEKIVAKSKEERVICTLNDIMKHPIENASMVILNFTLQFIPLCDRQKLLSKIHEGLNPGGCLFFSEKIKFPSQKNNNLYSDLHHEFKRWMGYSNLEISQKRDSIENVLIPESEETHLNRLESGGFVSIDKWFQYLNFCSFIALKPS